jgi:hypothetical protein
MSSKAFGKRFGFKRTNTNQDPVTINEVTRVDSNGNPVAAGSSKVGDVDYVGEDHAREISEVEANDRLHAFRMEHKWDPNMVSYIDVQIHFLIC